MDTVSVSGLSKKFVISHEKEAIIRSILPSIFRPGHKEELWALRDIAFTLKRGESLGVIGPNAAGKSVLLNILAGITAPTTGDVKLSGRVSTLLTLGAGFNQELTGEENIFLNATILGMPLKEIRQKFDSIVNFCELDAFIDAPIQTYSTGMLMRLGFSIATHVDFDILLVDEIIGVGDIEFRKKSLNKLKEFRNNGKTIIIASQEVGLIREITDKAIYLRKGLIEGHGDSDKITKMYEESAKRKESILLDENLISDVIKKRREECSPDKVKSGWGLKSGTKDAEILDVVFSNKDERRCSEFNTGESLEVKVLYKANKEIRDPHFGVAIFREDRVYCHGPNTRFDNLPIDRLLPGEYKFSIYYPYLSLSTGVYFVSVAIWEKKERYAYDYHCAFYKMIVKGEKDNDLFYQAYMASMEIAKNGSGKKSVKITDRYGKEKDVFRAEEPLIISTNISYDRKASDFIVKVYSEDDILCFIMHKKLKVSLVRSTSAKIEFNIPKLSLLTGNYYISTQIKGKNRQSLASETKLKAFTVFSDKQDHGLVYLDHKWNLGGMKNEESEQKTQY